MKSYTSYDDGTLVHLLSQGDEAAFTELYERYWEHMLGIAFNRLKDLSAAEDVVHDVFASLWKNRQTQEIAIFKNWMATAVKYITIRAVGKAAKQERFTETSSLQPVQDETISDRLADKQIALLLQAEINKLPERCRVVFQLKQQGLSNQEVADEMNISVKTVENQVNKGVRALKGALKHHFLSLFLFF